MQRSKRDRKEAEARAKVDAEMKVNMDKTSKESEAKVKSKDESVERARVWDEANAKKKAKIARVNAEAREGAYAKVKVWVTGKSNAVHLAAAEAISNIRAKAEDERGKKEREEAEEWAKDEAEIK